MRKPLIYRRVSPDMTKHPTPRGILLASFLTTEVEEEVLAEVTHLAETANLTNQWIFLLEDVNPPEAPPIAFPNVEVMIST